MSDDSVQPPDPEDITKSMGMSIDPETLHNIRGVLGPPPRLGLLGEIDGYDVVAPRGAWAWSSTR